MTTLRLLIVDDHEVVRLGLRTLLGDQPGMRVAGEAGSAREALSEVGRLRPDVAVVDIHLPDRSGLEVCKEIRARFPETRVVMLTSSANENFVVEALEAGASGYVLKHVGNMELIRAIQAAASDQAALDPVSTARMVERLHNLESKTHAEALRELSPREMEVLAYVAEGKSNKEIAAALKLRDLTIRNYISNMLEKLGLANRVELARFALLHGISNPEKE